MYKQLLSLVLFLALIVWVYVTIIINRSYASVEGFTVINRPDFNRPDNSEINYLQKLNDDVNGMSSFLNNDNNDNNNKGIAPVIDTLKQFVKKNTEQNQLTTNSIKPEMPKIKCKFMPSYSESFNCPERHSNHLGAVFGAKASSGLNCNGKNIVGERAKAYAVVRDGKITKIKLISKGSHYLTAPKIKILGNGQGASARAILDTNNTVKAIKITNPGVNYLNSPKIIISNPDGYVYCHLCCNVN